MKAGEPYNLLRSSLSQEEKQKYREIARKENRSMSGLTTHLIQQFIRNYEASNVIKDELKIET